MRTWRSASVEETEAIGRELAAELAPNGVLLLRGDLGAGKTVLVRGLAAGLGLDPAEVQSPTFTLMREHRGGSGSGETLGAAAVAKSVRLVHLDLYRLGPDEVAAAGLEEALYGPGVKAVEWAERLPAAPQGALEVEIERDGAARTIRARRAADEPPAVR